MKTINKKIEMICYTNPDGAITPIRFRIESKNYSKQTYVLQRILSIQEQKLAGIKAKKYECEIIVNDKIKICELKFELDTCRWSLFKI